MPHGIAALWNCGTRVPPGSLKGGDSGFVRQFFRERPEPLEFDQTRACSVGLLGWLQRERRGTPKSIFYFDTYPG